jgi:glycosyltransferase involved in cell wall biosynthesis
MKISILTPVYNRKDFVKAAVESVLAQNHPDYEHIVIDGGSTDGTLEILARYPHLKVVNEPDAGMYDAINKGLTLASGEIIGFLNSDDLLARDIFADIERLFIDNGPDAVAGEAIVFSEDGPDKPVLKFSPRGGDLLRLASVGNPFFNAWFFRKSVFAKIGKFDPGYRITADREFMLRFALSDLEYAILDRQTYQYRQHAGSLTFELNDQKFEQIVEEHLKMSGDYLRQKDLPRVARGLIRQMRTRDTIKMAVICARSKHPGKGFYYFKEGIKFNPAWPVRFVQKGIEYVLRAPKSRE